MSSTIAKIAARAKQIRKAHPAKKWQDCIKQASRELKGTTTKAAPKKRTAKKRAVKKAPAKKRAAKKAAPKKRVAKKVLYRQTGTSSKVADKRRKAKQPGKRVVKHKGAASTVYYERRKNRSDVPGSLSGAGTSQDHAIQRVVMKRTLRSKGISLDANISDVELQKVFRKLTSRKVPSMTTIRNKLKKGIAVSDIINSFK